MKLVLIHMRLLYLIILIISGSECTYAQLIYARNGDTLKGTIRKVTEYTPNSGIEVSVYTGNVTKGSQQVSYFKGGNTFIGKWIAKYDTAGRMIESNLYCDNDEPCYMQTYIFDYRGRLVEERVVHHMSAGRRHFTCNTLLDIIMDQITEWFINTDRHVVITKYEYNNSNIARKTTESLTYNSKSIDTVFTEYLYRYDERGRLAEEEERTKRSYDHELIVDKKEYNYSDTDTNGNVRVKVTNSPRKSIYQDTMVTYYYAQLEQPTGKRSLVEDPNSTKEYDKQGNIIKIMYGKNLLLRRDIEYY